LWSSWSLWLKNKRMAVSFIGDLWGNFHYKLFRVAHTVRGIFFVIKVLLMR